MESQYEVIGHQQRLSVYVIPMRILHCDSETFSFDVCVFDEDLKIYCPDYPVQGCGMWKNVFAKCSVM